MLTVDGQTLRWALVGWPVPGLPEMGLRSGLPPSPLALHFLDPLLQTSAFQLSPTSPIFQGDNGQGCGAHL